MKLIRSCFLLLAIALTNSVCFAYEQDTHRSLSLSAVEQSALAAQNNNILSDFGLSTDISEFSQQKYPNSAGESKSIIELVQDGAYFEDKFPRPVHHFYDPINDLSLQHPLLNLAGGTNASPDWALEDTGEITGQDNSYKNATDAFYKALTLQTKTERDQQWGILFESLGNVIHHIQDMAQPEHVRNDLHCGEFWGCGLPGAVIGIYDPSLFEDHSLAVFEDGIPSTLVTYPSVTFPTAREFWTTRASDPIVTDRRGLADFTNRNFVSKDTNFEIKNGVPAPSSRYNLPIPSGTNLVDLATLDGDGAGICQRLNQSGPVDLPPNSPCEVEFIKNVVTDSYDPIRSGTNARAASLSFFDQYLSKYNVNGFLVEDGDAFHVMDVDRLITINEYNIDAAHTFLIPRAVAYSAGLIDHFFRGKIDMAPNPNGAGWVIKNLSNEDLEGTFTLYYDYIDQTDGIEKREPVPGAVWATNGSIASGDQMVVGTYTVPSGVLSKTLVFNGRIGSENNVYAGKYFGGWSGPVQVTSQYAYSTSVPAMDGNGNTIVVYQTYDAATSTYSLWSQRHTSGGSWASAILLSSGYPSSHRLAMDVNGNATVVYHTYDRATSTYNIWSRYYTPGSGWASAVLLRSDVEMIDPRRLAMDANGNATVVYHTTDRATLTYNLWSQRYTPGSGWASAVLLSSNIDARYLSLAMDANGNTIVIYGTYDTATSIYSLWSRYYTPGSGWASAVLLYSNNITIGYSSLAMGANGNAIVIYGTYDTATSIYSLWSQHYTPGSGWSGATLLSSSNIVTYRVVMDANGNATVVHHTYDAASSKYSLWSHQYTPGSGWTSAELLSSGARNSAKLAMDTVGNAIVVYSIYDVASSTLSNIVGRHYRPGIGWGNEILLSDGSGDLRYLVISMSENGDATLVWNLNDGTGNFQVWSNHYTP